jgi:hypothetical protein
MKKIFGLFSLAAILFIMSCGNDKPAEVKKEVIIVKPSPVIVTKDPPKKPTTISLDKNGVKVETKKVDVKIENK